MDSVPPRLLALFGLVRLFFRSDQTCDEPVCDISHSHPLLRYHVPGDEKDCVRSFCLAGHSLCESSKFVPIRMGPSCPCFRVCNEVPVLEEFAIFSDHGVAISHSQVIGNIRLAIFCADGLHVGFSL